MKLKKMVQKVANGVNIKQKSVFLTKRDGTIRAYREYGQLGAMQKAFIDAVLR